MNNHRASAMLWGTAIGLLTISLLMLGYLVVGHSVGNQPSDVYEKLEEVEKHIDESTADRWTGSQQKEFAELNNLKMPGNE